MADRGLELPEKGFPRTQQGQQRRKKHTGMEGKV